MIKIKLRRANSHLIFGRFECTGVMLNVITAFSPPLSQWWGAATQLVPSCYPTADSHGHQALWWRWLWGQGWTMLRARQHNPGAYPSATSQIQALGSNSSAASELCPQPECCQPLWCPRCWLGSAWQAHGFPFTRTLDQLCSLGWVGRGEDIFHKPCGHWNTAARLFCPKVILYTALRSHAVSG